MAIFKCKMCGGDLDIQAGASVGTCQYCSTQQTLPKLDDDRRANLYDRANHFRRNNEYDKAMGLFETILNEDRTDAEAYWSLVLCKYGIEYVEDPSSNKRIPTCNRTQYASILADEDYKQAIAYADGSQRSLYEEEAKVIEGIQKGILEVSNKEEPFDIFICYKESDDNGRRTPDSVLAQDMYNELTNEGFKVFFSRITLEDKIGSAYEPYIFAALQSSKIMVVIGTKPEFFNSVWVKNEWSRYLALTKDGTKKVLIPAFRDMDAYDLPDEFSHLQAQDMGKLGFMQDLIRGIKKMMDTEQQKNTSSETSVTNTATAGNADALIRRAYMFLEDSNFDQASEYFDRVLDNDPENAHAYVGLLLGEYKLKSEGALSDCGADLDKSANFQKAVRFADNEYKKTIERYAYDNRANGILRLAKEKAQEITGYNESIKLLESIKDFKDANQVLAEIEQQVVIKCTSVLERGNIDELQTMYNNLVEMNDFGGADRFREKIEDRILVLKEEKQLRDRQLGLRLELQEEYIWAQKLMKDKEYKRALAVFRKLGDYKDSEKLAQQIENMKVFGQDKLKRNFLIVGVAVLVIILIALLTR